MTTIDLTIQKDRQARAIQRARERKIIIPTFAQMKDPARIPAKVKESLKGVGLWDVDPQGKETLLTRGWLKGSHREIDRERSTPWQPFHPHTNPKPLVPGQVYEFNIEIIPTANLFKVGHRICLKISGADDESPQAMLDLIRGHHLWGQTHTSVTIYHDADRPSYLLLPITRGNIVGTFLSGGDISLRELKVI